MFLCYNISEYQNEININTQGRRQTNAMIEKCAQTLRQFHEIYENIFAIRNFIANKTIDI